MPEIQQKTTGSKYNLNNYNKWDNIHVSDDEDDTHPNVDTPSLFRWRHKARVEREQELKQRRFNTDTEGDKLKQKIRMEKNKGGDSKKLEKLNKDLEEWKVKEAKLAHDEKAEPWNVDTMSTLTQDYSHINKPKKIEDLSKLSEDERMERYKVFCEENESKIKQYAMYTVPFDAEQFLKKNPDLVCEFTANFLCIYSIDLAQEKKLALFDVVTKQTICMQFILELAKGLKRHPAETFPAFFKRYTEGKDTKEGIEYHKAFNEELNMFRDRAKQAAKARDERIEEQRQIAEAQEQARIEEEERKARIEASPSGIDPQDVFQNSPEEMQQCYIDQDVGKLQDLVSENPEKYMQHMRDWVLSGLWVPGEDSPLYPLVQEAQAKKKELQEKSEEPKLVEVEGDKNEEKEALLKNSQEKAKPKPDILDELD